MAELPELEEDGPDHGFQVILENFRGPFDVLLGLIAKHELDITEVSLARVTDEFIAYIRELQDESAPWALDEASEFLVIAATLLDLKAARLLPSGEVEDEEDVARLEARDLLFARLLQYKAFKDAAALMSERLAGQSPYYPRAVSAEPQFAALLPELIWNLDANQFARLAAQAFTPDQSASREVGLAHLHSSAVSVRDQAAILAVKLSDGLPHSFSELSADAGTQLVVVVRFLALLEMYRDRAIALTQDAPLTELSVRWEGDPHAWNPAEMSDEYGHREELVGGH